MKNYASNLSKLMTKLCQVLLGNGGETVMAKGEWENDLEENVS